MPTIEFISSEIGFQLYIRQNSWLPQIDQFDEGKNGMHGMASHESMKDAN